MTWVNTGKTTSVDVKNTNVTYYYDKDDLELYNTMMQNWKRLK